jgi:hypothetical protein
LACSMTGKHVFIKVSYIIFIALSKLF